MAEPIDKKILKTFVPADALKAENFQELASKTFLEPVAAGKIIFKEGWILVRPGEIEVLVRVRNNLFCGI